MLVCQKIHHFMFLISWHCVFSSIFSRVVGDLVEAVVPYMGESISDGTLVKFLKSTLSCVHLLLISYINRFSFYLYVVKWKCKTSYLSSGTLFICTWTEPGDRVHVDEPIAQIETDKVDSLTRMRLERCKFSSQTEPNWSLNLSLPFRWRLMWLVLKLAS